MGIPDSGTGCVMAGRRDGRKRLADRASKPTAAQSGPHYWEKLAAYRIQRSSIVPPPVDFSEKGSTDRIPLPLGEG
ncbi:MAG: hypothetical protein OXC10_11315, partial [Rhodospirillaceae bacterium]|nr:hypothetical protein [Rhodospirillaceae bacterium]